MRTKLKLNRINHLLIIGSLLFTTSSSFGQSELLYDYQINLSDIHDKQFEVELNCADFAQDTLIYNFPWIIPGTYSEANYGKYIHKLKAFDQSGNELKLIKEGENTFLITPANQIQTISYWVSATWEDKKAIWPMAGTGIITDRAFIINAGGVFGYFKGEERQKISMHYSFPEELYAMTILDQEPQSAGQTIIKAEDYHELVDSPIMFAFPDTTTFKVNNTEVLVGFSHETDDARRSGEVTAAITPAMTAIAAYIDSLPADEYAYLVYYADEDQLGKLLDNPKFIAFKFMVYVLRNGMPMGGALEHNKSSFYYLPDPGPKYTEYITASIADIAIHEFMHILTPLNLRSQYVHDWDYNDPIMSKHLWLYEGVTEYMSQIIQVNGGLKTPKEFLLETMHAKLKSGEKYPFEKLSFTEMAANVLEKKNQKQYLQVYSRGAVMGMLLDIEIMRLTDGKKRLIDVMLELIDEYGPSRPMDEETIFDDFTAKVHPELRDFFTRYIEGHDPLPYEEVLSHVGVIYKADTLLQTPKHPIKDDRKVKKTSMSLSRKIILKKAGRKNAIGLKSGDQMERRFYQDNYFDEFGNALAEGTPVSFTVLRGEQEILLSDTIRYKEDRVEHYMEILQEMSPQQDKLYKLWLGIESANDSLKVNTMGVDMSELDLQE